MSVRAVTVFFPSQFVSSTHDGCVSADHPTCFSSLETSCSFSRRPVHQLRLASRDVLSTGQSKKAVYSLTGNASSPFHAEPAHHNGTAIIYAAQSVSLCALEVLANSSKLPSGAIAIEIRVPDSLTVRRVELSDLPHGWDDPVPPDATRDIGTNWARAGATAVLSDPSSIVPSERNYLLNPNHADFARIGLGVPEPFRFDPRLK
jgi:RES domain-containing protein